MKKVFLLLFLFIILGGLFYYKNFVSRNLNENNQELAQDNQKAIYVIPRQRPGMSVNISFASLKKSGYIVINADNKGGFGAIIGNSVLLPSGESRAVMVGLVRQSVNGESLFAVVYEDSGDGVFTPGIDIPVKDEDGNIIFSRFNIDKNAPATP